MKIKKSKKLPAYNEEIYKKIPAAHLIIFGVYSVLRRKEKCTFEKIIEECFYLFPKIFSFSRHPKWPDSLKFDRSLRTLREEGLIVGNPKTLFTLTKFGEDIAKTTATVLKRGLPARKVIIEKPGRDAEINWIRNLKNNEMFHRFLKKRRHFLITNMELRNLLRCTLETPLRIVKQNLAYSINLAEEFKEKELLKFLKFCRQKLPKK
jgi:hypothetical protein